MTSRERVLACIRHEQPYQVSVDTGSSSAFLPYFSNNLDKY